METEVYVYVEIAGTPHLTGRLWVRMSIAIRLGITIRSDRPCRSLVGPTVRRVMLNTAAPPAGASPTANNGGKTALSSYERN